MWVTLALFAFVLLLLLIFILENSQRVDISFLGSHGHLPLGIALLLAAVLGILLAVIAWFGRRVRVRTTARRARKT
jgi:lipopolysaccharide assembly protein A